jgi:hypothetical protein
MLAAGKTTLTTRPEHDGWSWPRYVLNAGSSAEDGSPGRETMNLRYGGGQLGAPASVTVVPPYAANAASPGSRRTDASPVGIAGSCTPTEFEARAVDRSPVAEVPTRTGLPCSVQDRLLLFKNIRYPPAVPPAATLFVREISKSSIRHGPPPARSVGVAEIDPTGFDGAPLGIGLQPANSSSAARIRRLPITASSSD